MENRYNGSLRHHKKQRETGSAAALPRPGPPKVLTDVDESVLARLSEELEGNYTWDEITKRFNEETGKDVGTMTIFRFCKSRGWLEVCDKACTVPPLLSGSPSDDKKIQKFARARFPRYVQYCDTSQAYVKFYNPR